MFKEFDLATIAKYIDWGPFFIAWEMPGRFPEVLSQTKSLASKQHDFLMMQKPLSRKSLKKNGLQQME